MPSLNIDEDSEEKEEEKVGVQITETQDLVLEDVKNVWNEFAQQLEANGDDGMYRILYNAEFRIEDHTQLIFDLDNNVLLDHFTEIKGDMIQYMMQKLRNKDIHIHAHVIKQKLEGKRLYTQKDKLDYVAEQNPAIKELVSRLGLDLDH